MASTYSFTGDSAGDPDPIVVPTDAGYPREVEIFPPAGHAWSVCAPKIDSPRMPLAVDQTFKFQRAPGQPAFCPGETIGYVVLDAGTGTFWGKWS